MRHRLAWLLVTVAVAAAMSGAGYWQRQRGIEKERWLADFEAAQRRSPAALAEALREAPTPPRQVEGRLQRIDRLPWLLLDNQRRAEQVGTRALAFYRSADSAPLLVDFGWQAWDPQRRLPRLEPPPESLEARGLLVALPGQALRLADNPPIDAAAGPALLAYLDTDDLSAALGTPVYPGLLRLDPALPIGFVRDLDALPNTLPPERHYGYSVQWFGMASAVVAIYLVLLLRKPRT